MVLIDKNRNLPESVQIIGQLVYDYDLEIRNMIMGNGRVDFSELEGRLCDLLSAAKNCAVTLASDDVRQELTKWALMFNEWSAILETHKIYLSGQLQNIPNYRHAMENYNYNVGSDCE
jgi:hypothetical protein